MTQDSTMLQNGTKLDLDTDKINQCCTVMDLPLLVSIFHHDIGPT